VRHALNNVEGVDNVKVNFQAGMATCTAGPEVKDEQLTEALAERFTATVVQ
jgi:copper chaperone CopZ